MKANLIGHSPSIASTRSTGQARAAAPTEPGPGDQFSLGGDWQWGDPLSALPERKQSDATPASWSWGDPIIPLSEAFSSPPQRKESSQTSASWAWGDPISAHPEYGQRSGTEKSFLEPPCTPAGWHWGDPLPSW